MWETVLVGNWKTKKKGVRDNYFFGKIISHGDMG